MEASTSPPISVLIALPNALDREAYAAKIAAEPGWRATFEMFTSEWDVALGERCIQPGSTVVLVSSGADPSCVCCRSTPRDTSWHDLLLALSNTAGRQPPNQHFSPDELTRRERQVLRLVGQGKSVGECADELGVAVSTVGNHKYRLMRKLKVSTSLQLMKLAIQHGFADDE